MKLELFDAYNIRVRLSTSVILFSPFVITLFFCFDEFTSFATSSVIIAILLAFTNYNPILQRSCNQKVSHINYAAKFLNPSDPTIDSITKTRYYSKLANADESFTPLLSSSNNETIELCCESAVFYLRNQTRDNRLVLEENINYGFCKNLIANKAVGIMLCLASCIVIGVRAFINFECFSDIPSGHIFAFTSNIAILLFWLWGVDDHILENAAITYAKTLLSSIDSLDN